MSPFCIVEHITEEDIRRVACRLFKSPPSMSALGTLDHLPDISVVKDLLQTDKLDINKMYG